MRLIHALIRPTLHRNTFFSFFLIHPQGHGWTAGKKFQIKIPHDVGAQDIFIWNSVAVLDWRAAVTYLCRRKEEKYAVKQQTCHLSLPVTLWIIAFLSMSLCLFTDRTIREWNVKRPKTGGKEAKTYLKPFGMFSKIHQTFFLFRQTFFKKLLMFSKSPW